MREFHRIIVEQSDHMRSLIGDLLDAGAIDSGTLSVAPEPSDLAALVEQARNDFLSTDARYGLSASTYLQTFLRVMAERRRIVQVLNNLFSNASRHAPEASPIRVSAVRDGSHVEVAVADDGKRHCPGAYSPPVQQAHGRHRNDGLRPWTRNLQGPCGSPWRSDPGGERRGVQGNDDSGSPSPSPKGRMAVRRSRRARVRSTAHAFELPQRERILVVDDDPSDPAIRA